jgi:hypothetical protein
LAPARSLIALWNDPDTKRLVRSFIFTVALILTGCDKPNPHICGSLLMMFPGVPITTDDHKQAATYCVERWAARLAVAHDPAPDVVDAVIANCDGAILAYEAAKAKDSPGSEMTPIEAHNYWRKQAQFIVIQTRAGHCYPNA